MTSTISFSGKSYNKVRELDINGLSSDSSPDVELDKMLVFSNGNQAGAHAIRLNKLNYKGRRAEVLCNNILAISQSTAGSFSPITETYVYIPPLKTYFIFYTIQYTTAVTTTGFQPVIDIDSNLVIRAARFISNSSGAVGQVITPNGDSTVIAAGFTGIADATNGIIMTGNAIISNTHASNTGESFIKFTTEVNTSAASLQAQQVNQICGRVYLAVMELE